LSAPRAVHERLHNGSDRKDHAKDTATVWRRTRRKTADPPVHTGATNSLVALRAATGIGIPGRNGAVARNQGVRTSRRSFQPRIGSTRQRGCSWRHPSPQVGAPSISGSFGAIGFAIPRGRIRRLPRRVLAWPSWGGLARWQLVRLRSRDVSVRWPRPDDRSSRFRRHGARDRFGEDGGVSIVRWSGASAGAARGSGRLLRARVRVGDRVQVVRFSCGHPRNRSASPSRTQSYTTARQVTVNGISRSWVGVSDARTRPPAFHGCGRRAERPVSVPGP
jgi:hypothetical protein